MRHKWIWSILVCLMLVGPACAQQPVQEYTIKVTAPELDVIGKALGTQPFNDVVGIIQKLRQQVVEQQAGQQKAVEPEKK